MKPMPDADENRRLAGIQNEKADKLPDGPAKQSHLKKARDHETSAHSNDWRDSNLRAPNELLRLSKWPERCPGHLLRNSQA
jgi:hypothetical protein